VKADPEVQVGQLARALCCIDLLCAEVRRMPVAVVAGGPLYYDH
jgi:hypothetical protein